MVCKLVKVVQLCGVVGGGVTVVYKLVKVVQLCGVVVVGGGHCGVQTSQGSRNTVRL